LGKFRDWIKVIGLIEIEALLDNDGVLRACRASGHAKAGKAGTDIVCAAVTVLLRTAFSTLSNRNGIAIRVGAPEEGELWLETEYDVAGKDFLFATGEFLVNGLKSVEQEYPQNCKLTIRRN
jgi:uncharacterized protein YsxB (DUF464 family)